MAGGGKWPITSDNGDYRIQIAAVFKPQLIAADPQTTNLGVKSSNPLGRASNFKHLAKKQKALGSL
jgi:hypothetical protein